MAALTGTETLYVTGTQVNGSPSSVPEITTTAAVVGLVAGSAQAQYTAVSGNTPLTLTAAQISGAPFVTVNLTAALAAAGAVTLPTVALLAAAIPNVSAATAYNLRIINTSSGGFAWTVTTAAGWTLTGTMTIAQNTYRDFVVDFTSAAAATLTTTGTGTYS